MQLSTPPVVLLLPLYHIQCFISIREFVERCHLINIFKGPCFSKYFKIKKGKSHYNCPRRPRQSSDKGAKLVNDKLKNLQQGQSDFIFLLQIFWNCFILFIYPSECRTSQCSVTIARILENKLERKYSIGTILASLSKAECSLIQQNYYLFDYYDEVLKDIGKNMDIDFGKRIRTLGEIKKILAKTKKTEKTP